MIDCINRKEGHRAGRGCAMGSGRPRSVATSSTAGGSCCTPLGFLGATALVILTYSCTRVMVDTPPTQDCSKPVMLLSSNSGSLPQRSGRYREFGSLADIFVQDSHWPERGYGAHLDLRIYVYLSDEIEGLMELVSGRDRSIRSSTCVKGQWGTQVKIHQLLLESRFRTLDKARADFFFVPAYVKCVRIYGGLDEKEVLDYFMKVLRQMPYFHRSGGRDHVFVFPSGAGAHLVKDWNTFLNLSIFLTPEGDRTDKKTFSAFNTWKDILIPGNVDNSIPLMGSDAKSVISPLPLRDRKFLANYLGRAQGKTGRLQLLQLAKHFPDELEAPELGFRVAEKLERIDYWKHLRNAKFCLAPRGESSWTLRFYEAFFVECVPVILSDEIELPFQNVLEYSEFAIKWPSSHINEGLLEYLRLIPEDEITRMISRGRIVRCLFVYAPDTQDCSAMTGILWELQRKVRVFHQSRHSFWLHNGSIVDQNLLPMKDWRSPFPVP